VSALFGKMRGIKLKINPDWIWRGQQNRQGKKSRILEINNIYHVLSTTKG